MNRRGSRDRSPGRPPGAPERAYPRGSRSDGRRARHDGLTIVELLVVVVLLGIVLSLVVAFFVQQAQLTRRIQARNEVEINVRTVAEIILQDLEVVGAHVVTSGVTPNVISRDVPIGCATSGVGADCLGAPNGGAGSQDELHLVYATSLNPAEPCRDVLYSFSGTTLLRTDSACASVATPSDDYALADNILALDIVYLCANDTEADDPAACYAGSYPRQATVTVTGRSTALADVTATVTLTTSMVNLKF